MRIGFGIFSLCFALSAQTGINSRQVKESTLAPTCLTIYASGIPSCAIVGPNITITIVNGVPNINVVGGSSQTGLANIFNEIYTSTASQTIFTTASVPATNSLRVYRNGIRQILNVDYKLTSAGPSSLSINTVTFLTVLPFVLGETVLFDYQH